MNGIIWWYDMVSDVLIVLVEKIKPTSWMKSMTCYIFHILFIISALGSLEADFMEIVAIYWRLTREIKNGPQLYWGHGQSIKW